jgi:hypothetical protein
MLSKPPLIPRKAVISNFLALLPAQIFCLTAFVKFGKIFPYLTIPASGLFMENNQRQVLLSAIGRMMQPLIRILLRNGISFQTFADIAKNQFVEVARSEFGIEGRKQSTSRIAVITGLTRKEVTRISRLSFPGDQKSAERYNRASRVVSGWRRDGDFLDPEGKPAVLALSGRAHTFQELVKRYSGDMPYRSVLDELVAQGVVHRQGSERVKLMERAYLPKADEAMKLHILGTDTGYLIETIGHNLRPGDSGLRFQRKVLYENLPDEVLPALRHRSSRMGQGLLEKLDKIFSRHDRDANPDVAGSGRNTAGIGIYYFEKPHVERSEK